MGKPFFILLCLLAGIYTVRAQNINDSVRVLFIGNSYTHFNKLPDDIQKIAATQKIILYYIRLVSEEDILLKNICKNKKK